jgi:HK97 gp10 family phage protein
MGFDFSQVDRLAADLAAAPAVVAVKAMRVVSDTADAVQQDAQGFAPVLTGELRASIEASAHGLTAEVSADAGYAAYVEYGTSDTAPQPFMRPAVDANEGRLADGLSDVASGIL